MRTTRLSRVIVERSLLPTNAGSPPTPNPSPRRAGGAPSARRGRGICAELLRWLTGQNAASYEGTILPLRLFARVPPGVDAVAGQGGGVGQCDGGPGGDPLLL